MIYLIVNRNMGAYKHMKDYNYKVLKKTLNDEGNVPTRRP